MKKPIDSKFYASALEESQSENCDESKVLEFIMAASAEGDDRATYSLSTCYYFGVWGVEIDAKRAHNLALTLEQSNIAEAIFNLAVDFDLGKNTKRNPKRAFSLYLKAALLGDKEACKQVSQFFESGELVQKDKIIALEWKKRSECDEKEISPPYRRWP